MFTRPTDFDQFYPRQDPVSLPAPAAASPKPAQVLAEAGIMLAATLIFVVCVSAGLLAAGIH